MELISTTEEAIYTFPNEFQRNTCCPCPMKFFCETCKLISSNLQPRSKPCLVFCTKPSEHNAHKVVLNC